MKIGIDLGTTNSCAAYINENGEVVTIPQEGGNTIASAVSCINDGFTVGKNARERAMRAPEETVVSAKRLIGKPWYDAVDIAEPYGIDIRKGPDNEPVIMIGKHVYTIPQISGEVLTAVKISAENLLHRKIDSAVITVPAYFNDAQRDATRKAGIYAGLNGDDITIISEPTAAALAYGKEGNIAVYDLGGGTFDISIVNKKDGKTTTIATGGDLHLGGDDIDAAILDILAKDFLKEKSIKLLDSKGKPLNRPAMIAIQRLRNAAEKLKIALSSENEAEVTIHNLFDNIDWTAKMKASQLHQAMRPFVEKSLKCCTEALEQAKEKDPDFKLDSVVLVGGSTKSPYIRGRIEKFFGLVPDTSLNPDEAVARGAALSIDLTEKNAFVDVTPLDLFMETADKKGSVLIPRHSELPAVCKKVYTNNKDNQTSISFIIRQGTQRNSIRLGTLFMNNLTPGPAKTARVEVTFEINKSGLITVYAHDLITGRKQKLEIKRSFA